jgi:hypothetical protein
VVNKTLVCQDPDCNYTVRSPLATDGSNIGCRGVHESVAEPRKCAEGHGWMIDPNDPYRKHKGGKE